MYQQADQASAARECPLLSTTITHHFEEVAVISAPMVELHAESMGKVPREKLKASDFDYQLFSGHGVHEG
jgi:hypothetical protein